MAHIPNTVWKTMNKKDYHQFATAVFFLFAAIGPLTLLMESTIIQASWVRLFVMTILCGLFSWSIVMSLNKPFRLLSAVIVYVAIIFSIALIDPTFLQPDVDTVEVHAGVPFQLSKNSSQILN